MISFLITSKRLSKETYSAQLIINTLRCLLFRTTLDNPYSLFTETLQPLL